MEKEQMQSTIKKHKTEHDYVDDEGEGDRKGVSMKLHSITIKILFVSIDIVRCDETYVFA